MTGLELMGIAMEKFGENTDAGMRFIKEHFMEVPEPERSEMWRMFVDKWNELPHESLKIVLELRGRCEAGREGNRKFEEWARKAPPEFRKDILGEESAPIRSPIQGTMTPEEVKEMVNLMRETVAGVVEKLYEIAGGDEKKVMGWMSAYVREGKERFIVGAVERGLKKSVAEKKTRLEKMEKMGL